MKNNVFKRIDEAMMEEIERLKNIEPTDKNFKVVQDRAKTITLIADKVIQSQVAQLKMDIWNHSKNIKDNKLALTDASYIEVEE